MGKTVGHVAVVGGLAFPVIAEIVSVSQGHGFKWNYLSVLALALLGCYVVYSVWYFWHSRSKGSEIDARLPTRPGSIGLDLRGGTASFEDTTITGVGTGVKQTGGALRSKGLSVDGKPYGEEEEERL